MKFAMTCVVALALAGCVGSEVAPATQPVATTPTAKSDDGLLVTPTPGWVGVLLPAGAADVAPTADGKIDRVVVTVGQTVAKGSAIATLDPAAAREALAIAKGDLKAAQGMVAEASAMAGHARRRLDSERKLFAKGITAADDVSAANADRRKAGGAAASAMGQVASARARIEQLERQLKETSLAAPFTGRVALVYRENGALAGPSLPVVRLIDTSASRCRRPTPPRSASVTCSMSRSTACRARCGPTCATWRPRSTRRRASCSSRPSSSRPMPASSRHRAPHGCAARARDQNGTPSLNTPPAPSTSMVSVDATSQALPPCTSTRPSPTAPRYVPSMATTSMIVIVD